MYLAAGSSSSGYSSIILLVVVFGAFYFLLIRPMQRRQRQAASDAKQMRENLLVGTEIVTIGGLYGTVVDIDEDSVLLEISDGVHARYDRNAIARVISTPEATDEDSTDDEPADSSTDLDATANSIVEKND